MVEVVPPRIVVAGTHSGVGKTTVASGLMAALSANGYGVAPFKVGPDFIDPSYHALATGRPGRNLDAFLSGPEFIAPLFLHGAAGADVAVIEGVMGLFDGKSGGGELASTAHIAKLLDAPVLLVVDASAMARSVAALVYGYASFDPEVHLAGVVLNRVGSPTHEAMLREALAPLGIPVAGVLRRNAAPSTPDRHLGLVPVAERPQEARIALATLGETISSSCDLDAVLGLASTAGPLDAEPWNPASPEPEKASVRVAVAGGPAFSFIYKENLELLEGAGAEVSVFDPIRDMALPEGTDALYLGGGFPETYAAALSDNEALRGEIKEFAGSGRPVVAECGGLLFLARDLDGYPMCGVLDARARMSERLTLGYREARATADSPLAREGEAIRSHEFHYSVVEPGVGETPAWDFTGRGAEGFISGGVHASYLHTHWAANPEVPRRLVRSAAAARAARTAQAGARV